jgi:hypothetical protein
MGGLAAAGSTRHTAVAVCRQHRLVACLKKTCVVTICDQPEQLAWLTRLRQFVTVTGALLKISFILLAAAAAVLLAKYASKWCMLDLHQCKMS